MLAKLQRFDFYVKYDDTIRMRTLGGAFITVGSMVVMALLFLSEFMYFRAVHVSERLTVDDRLQNETVHFRVTIGFPSLKCDLLNIDSEDQQGRTQLGIDFLKRGWDHSKMDFAHKDAEADGCLAMGVIHVNKVAGNFRIALGHARAHEHHGHAHTVYQFDMNDLRAFNSSHFVQELTVGPQLPKSPVGLNGVTKFVTGVAQFKYFLKIVPVEYHFLDGSMVTSYHYSFTEHYKDVQLGSGSFPHPGVFVKYEFAPVKMVMVESRRTFLQFITSVCAIVGGIFTVAGMLDGCLYTSQRALKKIA